MPKRGQRSARITLTALRDLPAEATLWDTEIKGFGVRRQGIAASFFLKTRVNGRQRWITIGRQGSPWTPDTARTEALRLLLEARSGNDPVRQRVVETAAVTTLNAAIDRFTEQHLPKLKPRSRSLYGDMFERFIRPRLGKMAIADIGPDEIANLHAAHRDTPRQANIMLTVLSSLIGWAMDNRLLPRTENPCAAIKRFPEGKKERFLSREELVSLLKTLGAAEQEGKHSWQALAALTLLLATGARTGEILSLQWDQVSLSNARLTLPDSKTGFKHIQLNAFAVDLLKNLPRIPDTPFVIPGRRRGKAMVNLHSVWTDVRDKAGITGVRIHDLRHSFASFAADAGASLPAIGKLLGHRSTSTTARYAHLTEQHVRTLNSTVGEAIQSARDENSKTGTRPTRS